MKNGLSLIAMTLAFSAPLAWADEVAFEAAANSSLREFEATNRDNLLIRSSHASAIVRHAEECCKVCTKGKACGNSCINRNYECHEPPGCACDG